MRKVRACGSFVTLDPTTSPVRSREYALQVKLHASAAGWLARSAYRIPRIPGVKICLSIERTKKKEEENV